MIFKRKPKKIKGVKEYKPVYASTCDMGLEPDDVAFFFTIKRNKVLVISIKIDEAQRLCEELKATILNQLQLIDYLKQRAKANKEAFQEELRQKKFLIEDFIEEEFSNKGSD